MNMPPVVKGLLLANVIMFVIDSAIPLLGWDVDLSSVLGLYYFQQPLFRPWQPFTYMFMHASFSHIFFNMFALWMFGRIIEQVWGAKRFLIYYIVCGLGAAFVQELCQMIGLPPISTIVSERVSRRSCLIRSGLTASRMSSQLR